MFMKQTPVAPVLCLLAAFASAPRVIAQNAAQVVEVHASKFAFSPSTITIHKGQATTLALTSDDVPHSLLIKGLDVNAPMSKGHVTNVTITPSATGDFTGRCGKFCGRGHGSMTFVVRVIDK